MAFWNRARDDRESQSERLRKYRNMHAVHYGTPPEERKVPEVRVPELAYQLLCPTCSRTMEGSAPDTARCRAQLAAPVLHQQLDRMIRAWRAGAVGGKVLPAYMRTLGLVRTALSNAVERNGTLGPPEGA